MTQECRRVLPMFEDEELSALELRDFQDLADQLLANGHDPSNESGRGARANAPASSTDSPY
jgi:hypothetical protein